MEQNVEEAIIHNFFNLRHSYWRFLQKLYRSTRLILFFIEKKI